MHQATSEPQNGLGGAIRRFQDGDRDGAIAALRDLLAEAGDDPEMRRALAVMLLQSDRLAEGVAELDAVIAARPERADAWASRGTAHLHLGHATAARDDLERALELDPRQADAWLSLAQLERDGADVSATIALLRRAHEALPGHPAIGANLAGLLAEHGDPAEAVTLLEPVVAGGRAGAPVLYNLGTALRRLGRADEAVGHLRRAVALQPGYAAAWHNLGNTLVDLDDIAGAFEAYDRSTALRRRVGGPPSNDRSFVLTSRTKLEHDIEQFDYLLQARGVLDPSTMRPSPAIASRAICCGARGRQPLVDLPAAAAKA